MVASNVAIILSSMCMDYITLTWLDYIPQVRALLVSDYHPVRKGVWPYCFCVGEIRLKCAILSAVRNEPH